MLHCTVHYSAVRYNTGEYCAVVCCIVLRCAALSLWARVVTAQCMRIRAVEHCSMLGALQKHCAAMQKLHHSTVLYGTVRVSALKRHPAGPPMQRSVPKLLFSRATHCTLQRDVRRTHREKQMPRTCVTCIIAQHSTEQYCPVL